MANILIGEVDYLQEEICVLVRLDKPIVLNKLSEIPISTKFLFILLGPKDNMIKYREIGKSVITLLSDEVIKLRSFFSSWNHKFFEKFFIYSFFREIFMMH